MESSMDLSNYKWDGLSSLREGTARYDHCHALLRAIDWQRLRQYASELQDGKECHIEDPIAIGGRHVVRILTFANGIRWVARFRMPSVQGNLEVQDGNKDDSLLIREVHGFARSADGFGAAFILMDCLPGNVGMDVNFNFIPQAFKANFFKQMANAQVQTCNLLFPRIGTPRLLEDGTVEIGPIPGIGGPFEKASAFIRAWSASARYPLSEQRVKEGSGSYGDEVWQSTSRFTAGLEELADLICRDHDSGPFPLVHVDYGHNNIIVDAKYNMLGVIDWEHAIVAPWETVDFPITLLTVPRPMDAPWNYNPDGLPKSDDLIAKYQDRKAYIQAVKEAESELSLPARLSNILTDHKKQDVATAMRLFLVNGKMGFYSKVLEGFRRHQ